MTTPWRLFVLLLSSLLLLVPSTVHGQQHHRIAFYFDRGCTGTNLALTEGTYSLPGGFDVTLTYTDFPHFAAGVNVHSSDNSLQLALDACGGTRMSVRLNPSSMPDARLSVTCMYANECQNVNTGFVHVILDGKPVRSMVWLPASTSAADSSSDGDDDASSGGWFWW